MNLKVTELQEDKDRLHERLSEQISAAIEEDHADVIILACTMETGQYKSLQQEFAVPVIDPTIAALKYTEMMVSVKKCCDWSVSEKGSFESPPEVEFWRFMNREMEILW